jgi:hypothetical protein
LKKVYQQAAVPVQIITNITAVQDSQSKRFLSPLISFDIFRDYLANQQTRKGKNEPPAQPNQEGGEEGGAGKAPPQKLLPHFLQERIRLRALKHLPVLVHFYKLITSSFSHRITEQQALELTVPQCIDLVRAAEKRTLQPSVLADTLSKEWEAFKTAWSGILHYRE